MSEEVTKDEVVKEELDEVIEKAAKEAAKELAESQAVDENDPLSGKSRKNVEEMLKNVEGMVRIMESQWMASARELGLKDEHMKKLAVLNDKYKQEPPEHLTEEQRQEWDYLNGIDHLTDEDIDSVFEEDHKVRGVDHTQTIDRIKGACQDFFQYLAIMKEYRAIHDAYIKLLELEEEKEIQELQAQADAEQDPDKKAGMLRSIDLYYNRKYLTFLKDELSEEDKTRIVKALGDEKKVEYWIKRTRDKLGSLKISSKFILECSQFEKRFLEEKYHKCSNVLLLYFMQTCIYSDTGNKKDDARTRTVCMVMAIDAVVRKTMSKERMEEVMNNIRALEDQFINIVPVPPTAEE